MWARAAAGTFTVAVPAGLDVVDDGLDVELALEDALLVDPADEGLGCASAPSLQLVSATAAARQAVTMVALAYAVKTLPISTWAASPVATVRDRVYVFAAFAPCGVSTGAWLNPADKTTRSNDDAAEESRTKGGSRRKEESGSRESHPADNRGTG